MNDNIKAGSDIHAGDGGYSEGTQEKYDEFVKGRNQSLAKMRIKELKEQAMEWVPNLVDPDTKVRLLNAEKFAELIVRECARVAFESDLTMAIGQWGADSAILKHFGVEE